MMRPGLHTRGVMRLARIKTNKQTNNTLQFYILTFPNTDIQDFGFSKHWDSCTYSRIPCEQRLHFRGMSWRAFSPRHTTVENLSSTIFDSNPGSPRVDLTRGFVSKIVDDR